MKTIKLLSILLVCTAFLHSESLQAAQGDRQTRQVPGFHGVSVSSGIDLYLSQKNLEEVVVEADADDMEISLIPEIRRLKTLTNQVAATFTESKTT